MVQHPNSLDESEPVLTPLQVYQFISEAVERDSFVKIESKKVVDAHPLVSEWIMSLI